MTPQLITLAASEPLERILDVIKRDGGVIVANMISQDLLQECMNAVEPLFAERAMYDSKASSVELGNDFFPQGSQRIYGLLGKVPDMMVKLLRVKVWQDIMGGLLNDEQIARTGDNTHVQRSGYMLASSAALRLVPGSQRQPLHRDQIGYQVVKHPKNPCFTPMVGCLIAGTRCTFKNGATAVIPGSHLWGRDRIPNIEECAYAEMEPGSALFTLGSTYHGAGENICDRHDPEALRTVFAVFGQRDYYRPDQDEVLSTPLSVATKLPDDILRLTGYYKAVGGTGFVENHESPVDYLHSWNDTGFGAFRSTT